MAWTTPRTWVTGEVLTSSNFNTHIRDNLAYLHGDAGAIAIGALPTFATFPFRRIDVGTLAVTLPAGFGGNQTLSPALTFASAFTAAPVVIAAGYSAGLPSQFGVWAVSVTTTGCTFIGSGGGNAPLAGSVVWHAIGQPA